MPLRPSDRKGNESGGFFALVGYTQQMLGSSAQFVQCLAPPSPGTPSWEAIHSFEIEADGQDTKIVRSSLVLTQFKFSTNPDKYPIRPADLKEIAESFRKSEARYGKRLLKPVQRILRSNRPLSSSARPDRHEIKYEQYDPHDARREVEAYAEGFGICEPAELQESLQRVVGRLILIGAESGTHKLTRAEFDKFVTGSGNPLSLVIQQAVSRMKDDLENFRDMNLGREEALAQREQVINAINQITDDAIVVITGKGGCGKSTALWQLLRMTVDGLSGSPRLAYLVRSTPGAPASFADLVDKLRGIPALRPHDDVALRRIKAANPGRQPPILFLGWDGIDQLHSFEGWRAASRRIIEFFWGIHQEHKGTGMRPPARLLVSCRRKEEFEEQIATITGHRPTGKPLKYVELDVFSDSELMNLLSSVDGPYVARLSAALDSNPMPAFQSDFPSRVESDDLPAHESVAVLRQPIMWRCFCELAEPLQLAFLDGDSEALAAMAGSYLTWFGRRVNQRHGLDQQDVEAALDEIARAFPSVTNANSRAELYRHLGTVFPSSAEGRRLYGEGISSGLFDQIPPTGGRIGSPQYSWRWRHAFVVEYLLKRQ